MTRFLGCLFAAAAAHWAVLALVGQWTTTSSNDAMVEPVPQLELTAVELSLSERDEVTDNVGVSASSSATMSSPETPSPEPPMPRLLKTSMEVPAFPEAMAQVEPPKDPNTEKVAAKPSELEVPEQSPSVSASEPVRDTARVDVPPRPGTEIRPVYPRGCRRRGEQGVVTLEIEVSAAGLVGSASVAVGSGYAELDAAALAAVRRAVFTQATSKGRPVAGRVRLPIAFRLNVQ